MNSGKFNIVPCIPIGDKFPLDYYVIYTNYQKELLAETNSNDKLETEKELIEHYNMCGGTYTDNLVYKDNTPIGLICYQVIDWLDDNQPILVYIDHFYIKKEYRGKGYGTQLFNELVKKYKKAHIYFYVLKDNKPAQLFWPKCLKYNNMEIIKDDRAINENEEENLKYCDKFIVRKV